MATALPAGVELRESGALKLLLFPPSRLGVYARVTSQLDGAVSPARARDAINATGAVAVLDGPMFDNCPGQDLPAGDQAARYAASRCALLEYRHVDIDRGVDYGGRSPGAGLTVAVVGNDAVVSPGGAASLPPGARVAVQLAPALVRAGRPTSLSPALSNPDRVQRAGMCVMRDGRLAFAVAPATLYPNQFGAMLAEAGALEAGYTDGGGSTRLELADGRWFGARENRPVASWLCAMPEKGAGAWVALGLALAAGAGVAAYAYSRQKRR